MTLGLRTCHHGIWMMPLRPATEVKVRRTSGQRAQEYEANPVICVSIAEVVRDLRT